MNSFFVSVLMSVAQCLYRIARLAGRIFFRRITLNFLTTLATSSIGKTSLFSLIFFKFNSVDNSATYEYQGRMQDFAWLGASTGSMSL